MDEVDGMSGGDRGGVADLMATIARSKIPIICICNDKYNQKLRSLRNKVCCVCGQQRRRPACRFDAQFPPSRPGHAFIMIAVFACCACMPCVSSLCQTSAHL
jgi:hypothetical protein